MTELDRDRIEPIHSPELAALVSQLPPSSLDAEIKVIGGVLLDPNLYKSLEWLGTEDFTDSAYRTVWSAIAAVAIERPPDLMAVSSWLQGKKKLDAIGGLGGLAQLVQSTVSTAEAETGAIVLREMRDRRQLINAGYELQKLAFDRLSPVHTLYEQARNFITPLIEESGVMTETDLDVVRCQRLIDQVRGLILDPKLTPAQRKYKMRKLAGRTGYSISELKDLYHASLIEGENEASMTIAQLREQYGDQITEWVAHGWFPRGRTTLLHAEGGTGKTLWAYDFIFHLVTGTD